MNFPLLDGSFDVDQRSVGGAGWKDGADVRTTKGGKAASSKRAEAKRITHHRGVQYKHNRVPRNKDLLQEYGSTLSEKPITTLMVRNIPNRYSQEQFVGFGKELCRKWHFPRHFCCGRLPLLEPPESLRALASSCLALVPHSSSINLVTSVVFPGREASGISSSIFVPSSSSLPGSDSSVLLSSLP